MFFTERWQVYVYIFFLTGLWFFSQERDLVSGSPWPAWRFSSSWCLYCRASTSLVPEDLTVWTSAPSTAASPTSRMCTGSSQRPGGSDILQGSRPSTFKSGSVERFHTSMDQVSYYTRNLSEICFFKQLLWLIFGSNGNLT